jgi:hypothetical protein
VPVSPGMGWHDPVRWVEPNLLPATSGFQGDEECFRPREVKVQAHWSLPTIKNAPTTIKAIGQAVLR